jgi:phage shock protein A
MALINRISRLITADFHAVIDQIEEPGQLLKQAIRDMRDDLAETERQLLLGNRDQDAFAIRQSELQTKIANVSEQLDLCFASKKDDLARALIRKKLEAERLLQRLTTRSAANEHYLGQLKATLGENRTILDGLQQKADLFQERMPGSTNADSEHADIAWMNREMNVGEDEVEIEFLREKNSRGES